MSRHSLLHCECESCRREHFEAFVVTVTLAVMAGLAVVAWFLVAT